MICLSEEAQWLLLFIIAPFLIARIFEIVHGLIKDYGKRKVQ